MRIFLPNAHYILHVENEHPVEDMLEQFALGRLSAERMIELSRHFDICATCREALDAEKEFIAAIRASLLK